MCVLTTSPLIQQEISREGLPRILTAVWGRNGGSATVDIDGEPIRLHIWDTDCVTENDYIARHEAYQWADVIMICYSTADANM